MTSWVSHAKHARRKLRAVRGPCTSNGQASLLEDSFTRIAIIDTHATPHHDPQRNVLNRVVLHPNDSELRSHDTVPMAAMMPSGGGNQSANPYEHYDAPVDDNDDLIDPDDGKSHPSNYLHTTKS